MDWIGTLLRYTHVTFGFAGLAAFWIPVLSRKGGPTHMRFGRLFVRCAQVVLASAGLAVIFHVVRLAVAGYTPLDQPSVYAFLVFLGYLALVTWISIRHAYGLMQFKGNPLAMNTGPNHLLARLAMLSSAFLVGFAIWLRPPNIVILLALAPVGFATGRSILRYISHPPVSRSDWLCEHLSGMIGAGIAFHTAFAVFGARQLFQLSPQGWAAVLPWVLPAAVGIPAIVVWTRYYRWRSGNGQLPDARV
jgi:hypothetical protein